MLRTNIQNIVLKRAQSSDQHLLVCVAAWRSVWMFVALLWLSPHQDYWWFSETKQDWRLVQTIWLQLVLNSVCVPTTCTLCSLNSEHSTSWTFELVEFLHSLYILTLLHSHTTILCVLSLFHRPFVSRFSARDLLRLPDRWCRSSVSAMRRRSARQTTTWWWRVWIQASAAPPPPAVPKQGQTHVHTHRATGTLSYYHCTMSQFIH